MKILKKADLDPPGGGTPPRYIRVYDPKGVILGFFLSTFCRGRTADSGRLLDHFWVFLGGGGSKRAIWGSIDS